MPFNCVSVRQCIWQIALVKLSKCFVERSMALFRYNLFTSKQPSWLSDMDDHSGTVSTTDIQSIDELNHRLIQVGYNLDMGHYRHGYWPMV